MNKAIQAIATTMIIILIVALIWIFLSYYRNNDSIDTIVYSSGDSDVSSLDIPNGDYINDEDQNSTLSGNQSLIESIINDTSDTPKNSSEDTQNINAETSGDKKNNGNIDDIIDNKGNELSQNSGEVVVNSSGDKKINSGEEITPNNQATNNENPEVDIVIVSEPQTSNQEKQEVLAEIDKALQGLLEAVSKVEVVDETRLDASLNSEVEKP